MKAVKFLIIALFVMACHKKHEHVNPTPPSTTSNVWININSYKYYITQVRYKIRTFKDSSVFTYKTFDSPAGSSSKISYTSGGFYFNDTTIFDKGVLQEIKIVTSSNDPSGSQVIINASDISNGTYLKSITFPFVSSNTSGTIYKDSTQFKAN